MGERGVPCCGLLGLQLSRPWAARWTALGLAVVCAVGCNAVSGVGDYQFGGPSGAGGTSSAGSGGVGATGGGGAGGTAGGGVGGNGAAAPEWYDPSFQYRRRLTLADSAGTEPQVDFPLHVMFDQTRIDYAHVQADGRDLRFVAEDDSTLLDYEIGFWDSNGTSFVYVEVPLLPAGTDTGFVWMYYGNPSATDAQDPAGTWSNGYEAVWHMDASLRDSTGNNHQGTGSNIGDAPGTSGRAQEFNGTNSTVVISQTSGMAGLFANGGTITAVIFPQTFGENNRGRIIDMSTAVTFTNGWGLTVDDSGSNETLEFGRGYSVNWAMWGAPASSVNLNTWQHVAVVFDESANAAPALYIDGVAQGITTVNAPSGAPQSAVGSGLRIGNVAVDGSRTFDGYIAEVRAASVSRSSGWIGAQVRAILDTIVTVGPEETRP